MDQKTNNVAIDKVLANISQILGRKENEDLERILDIEEIKVLYMMNKDKSPILDGFHISFYQRNWDIVGVEVIQVAKELFNKGKLLKKWNTTFLTLIPKIQETKDFKAFRPIYFCNVVYKIITKILVEIMKPIMNLLISKEHDGFVGGRQIIDGIIQMHEVLHSCHKKNEATMMCKLDMKKAYNMVNWNFLDKILQIFGFKDKWRDQIKECITNPKFLILIN